MKVASTMSVSLGDCLVNTAGGRRGAAFYREKCLGNGHRDLAGLKGHHGAVAFDDAQLSGGGRGDRAADAGLMSWGGRFGGSAAGGGICLHMVSEVPAFVVSYPLGKGPDSATQQPQSARPARWLSGGYPCFDG